MKYTGFLAVSAILAVIFVSPAFANGHGYGALTLEVPFARQDADGKSALTGVRGFSIAVAGCDAMLGTRCGTLSFSFFNLELSQNRVREIWNTSANRQFDFGLAMFEPGIVFPFDEGRRPSFLSLSALVGSATLSERATKSASISRGDVAYGIRFGLTVGILESMVATASVRAIGSPSRDFQDLFGTHLVISSLGLGMSF